MSHVPGASRPPESRRFCDLASDSMRRQSHWRHVRVFTWSHFVPDIACTCLQTTASLVRFLESLQFCEFEKRSSASTLQWFTRLTIHKETETREDTARLSDIDLELCHDPQSAIAPDIGSKEEDSGSLAPKLQGSCTFTNHPARFLASSLSVLTNYLGSLYPATLLSHIPETVSKCGYAALKVNITVALVPEKMPNSRFCF